MEQTYYLDCLLSIILKMSAQIGYNVSRLISILSIAKYERTDHFEKYKDVKNRDVCWNTKFKPCKCKTFYR
ncbi:hypothetical protein D0U04_25730 [Bacillus clarus]|uniref:Uncharacterized protein n=1 Tax=Bacillus clarus TaxID=2338372 RepID=A0ABX9KNS7_9BACI|nr:hypothetical protein D0U04_25730 [Bacillus clarus]